MGVTNSRTGEIIKIQTPEEVLRLSICQFAALKCTLCAKKLLGHIGGYYFDENKNTIHVLCRELKIRSNIPPEKMQEWVESTREKMAKSYLIFHTTTYLNEYTFTTHVYIKKYNNVCYETDVSVFKNEVLTKIGTVQTMVRIIDFKRVDDNGNLIQEASDNFEGAPKTANQLNEHPREVQDSLDRLIHMEDVVKFTRLNLTEMTESMLDSVKLICKEVVVVANKVLSINIDNIYQHS